jgi:hypothetical protein
MAKAANTAMITATVMATSVGRIFPPLPLFSKSKEEDMSGFDADQISALFEGGDITCSIIHK